MSNKLFFVNLEDLNAYQAGQITAEEVRRRYTAWVDSGANVTTHDDGSEIWTSGLTVNSSGIIECESQGGNHHKLWG